MTPRRPIVLVMVAAGLAACARWAEEPRFGSLRDEPRQLTFEHNIELLEVSNGMRIALVHDARTNLATVDMRYLVGAAEDPPGRTGMAHLVEHLLFELRGAPGGPTLGDELGDLALFHNATTSWDRTHYTATVPIDRLDAAIALEARRMTAPCEQLDEATFARERDVVLAETTQVLTPGLATMIEVIGAAYGAEHPYARPLGNREIAKATRAEACAFVAAHYAPERAILVVTGPFDRDLGKRIGRLFGPIARKASAPRAALPQPALRGTSSKHHGAVDRPTAIVFLPGTPWGSRDAVAFQIGRVLLAHAMARADDERPWISSASVFGVGGQRAPMIAVAVEVTSEDRLPSAADEVFARTARLFQDMTTAHARDSLADSIQIGVVSDWDDLEDRGSWIADYLQFTDHHWFMLQELRAAAAVPWPNLEAGFRELYTPAHSHVAWIRPSGPTTGKSRLEDAVAVETHDLVPWRAPVDPAEAERPLAVVAPPADRVERYELANGLRVVLADDALSPIVQASVVFPVGRAHEPSDRFGLATAAAQLLDHDYEGRYAPRMVERILSALSHGTIQTAYVGETTTVFTTRGLADWGDWHVWRLSWLLDQGRYNQDALAEMHRNARAMSSEAVDEETDPSDRAFGARLYGAAHPYANPPPDAGAAYLRLGAAELEAWKQAHYRARGATLIVSGRFDRARMKREIDELFAPWPGDAPAPVPRIPPTEPAEGPSWLAAHDDEARQVSLMIGFATASDPRADEAARLVLEVMLDDALRDIREGMGASYGVYARYRDLAAGGALLVRGSVEEGQAGEAAHRILGAIADLRDGRGDHRASFVRARRKTMAMAMARTGGARAVAERLEAMAARGQPPDHDRRLVAALATLTLAQVAAVAQRDLAESRLVMQVRGQPVVVAATFDALGVRPQAPGE